ncbi:MAG: ABC transporter [Solirubrobacterales bacterium 70-9]|nr:MAG: ABC transporter [Solirubrobacterales bacterium 70-9]
MTSTGTTTAALSVRDVSKTFAGTKALDAVSFDVAPGSVHALLGGNGSGKSTLIKILAGVYRADPGGVIDLAGEAAPADEMTPDLAASLGLRFVHQDIGVFPELTVAENIGLVNGFEGRGRVPWRSLHKRTAALLARFEVEARPDQPMAELRPADQTMVAVARALEDDSSGLAMLVLDEPTASLPRHEVELLLDAVRRCAASGQTILLVSHRIDEVLAIADAVTVLRDGREVITRGAAGLTEEELIRHIVGRSVQTVFPRPPEVAAERPTALRVAGLRGEPVRDASFEIRQGEVVGLAGLLGSGRTELLRMIFGAYPREAGEIELYGEPIAPSSPTAAMDLGIAYVPEQRGIDAAFPELTVRENLSLADVGSYRRGPLFDHRAERADAGRDMERFSIRAAGQRAVFSSLSGGNQQKTILARWLRLQPRLLLLDEPTHGVDVGARADVYSIIDGAVAEGLAVLLVSSDFEELSRVVDRVLVMRAGTISAAPTTDLDAQAITELVYDAKEAA